MSVNVVGNVMAGNRFSTIVILLFMLSSSDSAIAQNRDVAGWIQLFNGKNLDNWMVKFTGYELGENFNRTFRVEEGILKVSYENWNEWNGEFGHIFYDRSFSHYILRAEYRFVGEQVKGGPGWAFRNNGLMLHSQDPRTMRRDQEFPVSVETQLLGGNGTDPRTTANVCTPGTHIVLKGELIRRHCINSSSNTYHGDRWVTVEIEVHGSEIVRHKIDGKVVFEYTEPQLDVQDIDARRLLNSGDYGDRTIDSGYIALQAESHPTEFRKIEIKVLER